MLSEWAACMGFGVSVLVGAAHFGEDGARLTGDGGRNPPRMGIVSMCMCNRSGRGGCGVFVCSVLWVDVCHGCGHECCRMGCAWCGTAVKCVSYRSDDEVLGSGPQ